jgi:filamentous hemagglutinin
MAGRSVAKPGITPPPVIEELPFNETRPLTAPFLPTEEGMMQRVTGGSQGADAQAVRWVDENAAMSKSARDYQSGASGARSNIATRAPQAPEIDYTNAAGKTVPVRLDGQEGSVLVDRKISVTTYPKSQAQALRQSEALRQNGLTGQWEVPTTAEKMRADRMLQKLGIDNIEVRVVARQ